MYTYICDVNSSTDKFPNSKIYAECKETKKKCVLVKRRTAKSQFTSQTAGSFRRILCSQLLLWSISNENFKLIQWDETYELDDEKQSIEFGMWITLADIEWMRNAFIYLELIKNQIKYAHSHFT